MMRSDLVWSLPRVAAAVLLLTMSDGCFDEPSFGVQADTSGEVFFDGFPEGLDFQAFAGTNQANPTANALAIDDVEFHSGRRSLRFIVPGLNDPTGGFAGGAFVSSSPRDLSSYNALTFFVKGSRAATLNVAGFGNDNTGASRFTVERTTIPITADWTEVTVPLPVPARLTAERGLFHFAEAADGDPATGYTFWVDDLQFVRLADEVIGSVVPSIGTEPVSLEVDGTTAISDTRVRFSARPDTEVASVAPAWFDFVSADTGIAQVDADGVVRGVSAGQTEVSAAVAGTTAGAVLVDVVVPVRPTDLPAAPTTPAADVIALFSDAYAAVPVDTFRADWSSCGDVKDITVLNDTVKSFAEVEYVGIEFITQPLDVSSFTRLHLDVWTPDSSVLKIKLADFGVDGVYGNDDSEHELTFTSSSNPALVQNQWVSFDLPLSSFVGLTRRATLAQLILSASTSGLFVDNIYFAR